MPALELAVKVTWPFARTKVPAVGARLGWSRTSVLDGARPKVLGPSLSQKRPTRFSQPVSLVSSATRSVRHCATLACSLGGLAALAVAAAARNSALTTVRIFILLVPSEDLFPHVRDLSCARGTCPFASIRSRAARAARTD